MSEAPERIWDFWPHDGGNPVLWREPCPFPAEDAEVFEYVRADRIEEMEAKLAKAVEAMTEVQLASKNWNASQDSLAFQRLSASINRNNTTLAELTTQTEDE